MTGRRLSRSDAVEGRGGWARFLIGMLLAALGLVGPFGALMAYAQVVLPVRFRLLDEIPLAVGADAGVQAFALADVNGDARPDLIAITRESAKVSVFLNRGDGAFADHRELDLDAVPTAVAVADLGSPLASDVAGDFDGNPDIVVTDESGGVTLLLGDGAGGFEPSAQGLDLGGELVGVAVGDFDRNDRLDLAVVDSDDAVHMLCNTGGVLGDCATEVLETEGRGAVDIAAEDFNADEALDLVVLNRGSRDVSLMLGNGDGTFAEDPHLFSTAAGLGDQVPTDFAVGRLGDRTLADVAIVNFGEFDSLQIKVLYGRRTGFFGAAAFSAAFRSTGIALADFDDNGFLDVLTTGLSDPPVMSLDDGGAGGFTDSPFLAPGAERTGPGIGVAAADLDGDALVDFVVLLADGEGLRVAINISDEPTPTPRIRTPTPTISSTATPTMRGTQAGTPEGGSGGSCAISGGGSGTMSIFAILIPVVLTRVRRGWSAVRRS